MSGWAALLDALDEGLRVCPPVLADAPPTDLGPIPPALAARAAWTLRRMAEVEAALERDRARLAGKLAALSAARAATACTAAFPHFLDTKA
jgi:hypothetical protein